MRKDEIGDEMCGRAKISHHHWPIATRGEVEERMSECDQSNAFDYHTRVARDPLEGARGRQPKP